MSQRLKELRQAGRAPAGHGNAGLASNFIDLAHAKVRPGGVVALVLPGSFIQGDSWANARRLLAQHYRDVTVVSIAAADSQGRAFSADTGMAEVLVVATKRDPAQPEQQIPEEALYVNLRHRPQSLVEAHELAREIVKTGANGREGPIRVGSNLQMGSCITMPLAAGGAAQLREPRLAVTMRELTQGYLRLPHHKERFGLALATLQSLGGRGLLDRDITGREEATDGLPRGPFDIEPAKGIADYPILWKHDASRERCLIVRPEAEGSIRPGCEDRAVDVWQRTATRLHFNRDFRINSQSLAACLTEEPSIGGRAWPNFRVENRRWEEAIALWSNTTLGLMCFWWLGSRQQQGRAMLTISRLPDLLVLDPRKLCPAQLDLTRQIFDEFRSRAFKPANEAYRCDVRKDLDRTVLVELLQLPDTILPSLDLLRRQWCAEPTVHGGKSTSIELYT